MRNNGAITDTKKSHDLLSASWRCKKTSGIIQLKSKGLKTRRADGRSLTPRAGKD